MSIDKLKEALEKSISDAIDLVKTHFDVEDMDNVSWGVLINLQEAHSELSELSENELKN